MALLAHEAGSRDYVGAGHARGLASIHGLP